MGLDAGKKLRLTRRNDISRIFREGRRAADRMMTLFVIRGPDSAGPARLGVAVSSRHGGAVRRNRIKRLCREAFRLVRHELPAGWDYMIVPRVGGKYTLEKLQRSIKSLGARLARRAANGQERAG